MPQSADCGIYYNNMDIVFKNKKIVIVKKPVGVPTQSDTSGDSDLMSILSEELGSNGEPSELWLVHRLDRVVGGLVAFARTKRAAAQLSEIVGGKGMRKEYLAVVEGDADGGVMEDYIFKDAAKGKAFVVSGERRGAKRASLEYEVIAKCETERGIRSLVRIRLHTGRFHQIRVQFASRGMSLSGDGKYGSHDNRARTPALFAARLGFSLDGEEVSASALPPIDEYPWSLFEKECFKK